MSEPLAINSRIIEGLYCEALVLADEVRSAFTLSGRLDDATAEDDLARVALSCEALRTTTRMMHAVAWLLNHRAYLAGDLSEFQLRRHGQLAEETEPSDPARLAMLDPEIRELVVATENFHARLRRLDRVWRQPERPAPTALIRLRDRVEQRLRG